MDIIIEKGCGLDVHKETVVACIMGTDIKKEIKTYTTMTNDLLANGINKAARGKRDHHARESIGDGEGGQWGDETRRG